MERLTKKAMLAGHEVNYVSSDDCFCVWSKPEKFMGEAIDRLAAYEDTMPLERAKELAQAEKDGRLVVLPCKVGDTVFAAETNPVIPLVVAHVGVILDGKDGEDWESLDNFGKTVFFTREEAEAALKKREADNEAD